MDICKRNGKTKLLWLGDKDKTLAYEPKSGEMVLTVHRWFANKSCPGNWMYARMGDLAEKVTAALGSGTDDVTTTQGTQATAFSSLFEADVVKSVETLFTADQKKTGILASVSMAQFLLESGYRQRKISISRGILRFLCFSRESQFFSSHCDFRFSMCANVSTSKLGTPWTVVAKNVAVAGHLFHGPLDNEPLMACWRAGAGRHQPQAANARRASSLTYHPTHCKAAFAA